MATTILPIAGGACRGGLRRLPRGRGDNGGGGDRLGNRAVRGEEEVGRRKQAMRLFLLSPWRGLLPLRVFPFFVWTILPPGMWLSTSVLAVLVLLLEMKFARVRLQLQL